MDKPLIYTIGCPKCKALEKLFRDKDIEYDTCTDIDTMVAKGFEFLPQMEYQGRIYDCDEAEEWAQEHGRE